MAWRAFKANFLGYSRADKYIELVEIMLTEYEKMGCNNMPFKIQFLHSHLDFFPPNLGAVSYGHGEDFIKKYLKWKDDIKEDHHPACLQSIVGSLYKTVPGIVINGSHPENPFKCDVLIFLEETVLPSDGTSGPLGVHTSKQTATLPLLFGDNASEVSPGSSAESYPIFALNGFRETPKENLKQECYQEETSWQVEAEDSFPPKVNASSHKSLVAVAAFSTAEFESLDHSPYSPDLAPTIQSTNESKAISFTRKRNKIVASYTLGGETIPEANKCKYLGITFSSDLGWGEHVTDTTGKAWRALHFVMRVLRKGSDKSKEIAYKSLVRPVMEYGATCWDPYRLEHIKTLEKIKKRALKCCLKNSPLKWDTLMDRRTRIRLCALFKTYRGEPAWREIKNRLQPPNYSSRNDHSYKLRERRQRTDTGKFFFLNRTIRDWNALPAELLKALPTTKNVFKNRLKDLTNRRRREHPTHYDLRSIVHPPIWDELRTHRSSTRTGLTPASATSPPPKAPLTVRGGSPPPTRSAPSSVAEAIHHHLNKIHGGRSREPAASEGRLYIRAI
ncbi:hypothetical protein ANN_13784 [Periplaneta americana]|uniref:Uncharacterized protein n=1 Tax=Periplaneta americana TaxID=6978 RepID=A0ABQ8SUH2_PERAM|nr:hypothetical protein ANN_13784 [Periplaneta americana]